MSYYMVREMRGKVKDQQISKCFLSYRRPCVIRGPTNLPNSFGSSGECTATEIELRSIRGQGRPP